MSMTMKEVKSILKIRDTDSDNYIEEMLPLAVEFAKNYCNNQFLVTQSNGTEKEILNGGVMIAVAKLIEFYMNEVGVESESIARMDTTYVTEIPQAIIGLLEPYKKVEVKFL